MNKQELIQELAKDAAAKITDISNDGLDRSKLARELFDTILKMLPDNHEAATQIASPNAVVEVVDSKTGKMYRRYLELEYDETENGLRLLGDDIGGNPVQIVYLSNSALERMKDLQGFGPDNPVCNH